MTALIERTGDRHGHAVVVARSANRGRAVWWKMRCDCGTEFEASTKLLRKKSPLSCGCKKSSRRLVPKPGEMACEVPSPKYPEGRTGTYAGYQAHVKIQEAPCPECDKARAEYAAKSWVEMAADQRDEVRRKNKVAVEMYKLRHPSRRKNTVDLRRERNRQLIRDAKDRPCSDCGIQYPYYVMQFDHVRGVKSFNVSVGWNNSYERIEAEIAKCDVVCANCHAERTYQRMVEAGDSSV